jgi:hypothetical protein
MVDYNSVFKDTEEVDLSTHKEIPPSLRESYARFGGIEEIVDGKLVMTENKMEDSWSAVALDTIPFAKYALPEEQVKFDMLSGDEKAWALGFGVLGAALFVAGGPLLAKGGRALGGAITAGAGRAFPKMATRFANIAARETPIEDALVGIGKKAENSFVPFDAEDAIRKSLKGYKQEEVDAITKWKLTNNPAELKNAVLERSFKGKDMSTNWKANISPSGEPYGGFKPSTALATDLSEQALKSQHYMNQYRKVFAREVLNVEEKEMSKDLFQRAYQQQMKAKYPVPEGEVAAHNLENITERDFADTITDMLANKRDYRKVLSTTPGRFWPAALTPTRIVYGLNEANHGAYTGVYKVVKEGSELAKENTFFDTVAWLKTLEQRKLGKVSFSKYGEVEFEATELTAVEADKAYQILRQMDNISGQAKKGVSQESIDGQINSLIKDLNPASATKRVIDSWVDFSDTLYSKFLTYKIPTIIRNEGALTQFGQNSVDSLMTKLAPKILETFSTGSSRTGVQKIIETKQALAEIHKLLKPVQGTHPWFDLTGKELDNHISKLTKELTMTNEGGGLIGYTDHYTARISNDQSRNFEKWSGALVGKRGQFEQARVAPAMIGEPVDFKTMIESRIHSQSNAMYLYPAIDEAVANASKYPTHLASYVEHHIARILNQPSILDHKLARVFEGSIGKIEGLFGKEGTWNARRVMELGQTVNDLTYLGALGFKPFSAARNLFQPLVTVPADLGGLKDYTSLAKGYINAHKPEVRRYLNEIGIISEYAPEISIRPDALPFSKMKILGREIDANKWNSVKDAAMWMFKASDRFNRYVTGAAAMDKWNNVFARFPKGIDKDQVSVFMKQAGINQRNPWVKNELEDLLRRGKFDEAKAGFIRDVVGDTQFLYGAIDAPQIIGRGGAAGKTGLVFQSYWMNLMPLFQKWAVTGTADEKLMKAVSFGLSQAAAYTMMEPIWGGDASKKAIAFGPFPAAMNEYMIPPAWMPVYRAGRVAAGALQANPAIAGEQMKKLLGSTLIFAPGSLQFQKTFRGTREEGFKGFAKSIVGYPLESQVKD